MNAQERWKRAYKRWKESLPHSTERYSAHGGMARYRHEAALERIIARMQRENKEITAENTRLKDVLEMANRAIWRERL